MAFLANIFGQVMKIIYTTLEGLGSEPSQISYYAMSILILTLMYKLLTIPLTLSNIKFQRLNAIYGPQLQEIQKKYKNDPQTAQRKVQEFQKEKGFNPLGGCLPMIIQIFLVFALLRVMRDPGYYIFGQADLSHINTNFFWIKTLTQPDTNWLGLPLLNGLTQYILAVMMQSGMGNTNNNQQMKSLNTSMKYMMPLMIFWTSSRFVAGLALYWAFSNILEIIIRLIIKVFDEKNIDNEIRKESANANHK